MKKDEALMLLHLWIQLGQITAGLGPITSGFRKSMPSAGEERSGKSCSRSRKTQNFKFGEVQVHFP